MFCDDDDNLSFLLPTSHLLLYFSLNCLFSSLLCSFTFLLIPLLLSQSSQLSLFGLDVVRRQFQLHSSWHRPASVNRRLSVNTQQSYEQGLNKCEHYCKYETGSSNVNMCVVFWLMLALDLGATYSPNAVSQSGQCSLATSLSTVSVYVGFRYFYY